MEKSQEYIIRSLELHLFFARIMKEHALFLNLGLLPPNANLAAEGDQLLRQFEVLLAHAIPLSDQAVRCCVLESGELFTDFTDRAEQQTIALTGACLDRALTARTAQLRGLKDCDDLCPTPWLIAQVRQLNRMGLALVERIIRYKEQLLQRLQCCALFTTNYPLLIEHILREARLYRAHLLRLEGKDDCDCKDLRDSELFWNQIMMEHALFIRGLLDPTEEALIHTADDFADDYKRLLSVSCAANDRMICSGSNSLPLTRKFRDFKTAGVKGIEGCEIRSLILPLLADHVLREANHYIRLLED